MKACPWTGQSPRASKVPEGPGPDPLPKALDLDPLAEPEPGRLILIPLHGEGLPLDRPEPQGEQGPRLTLHRDDWLKVLAEPFNTFGFEGITKVSRRFYEWISN